MASHRSRPPNPFPPRRVAMPIPSQLTRQPRSSSPRSPASLPKKKRSTSSPSSPSLPTPSTTTPSHPSLIRKVYAIFTTLYHKIPPLTTPKLSALKLLAAKLPSSKFATLPKKVSSLPRKPRLLITIALFSLLTLLFFLFAVSRRSTPTLSHTQLLSQAQLLSKQPGNIRARALAAALRAWRYGTPPSAVIAASAACDARDAAEAAFETMAPSRRRAGRYGVVDVGAGRGYPLSKLAIGKSVGWVVAVEAVEENYWRLRQLRHSGVKLVAEHGLGGDRGGMVRMGFRDGVGCFGCLKGSLDGVKVERVNVYTVDGLMKRRTDGVDGREVLVFRVGGGYGREGEVLRGARRLLESGRVAHAIVGVESRKMGREGVLGVVRSLLGGGLWCVHLAIKGVREFRAFGESVGWRTADMFYQYLNATGGETELFCVRR